MSAIFSGVKILDLTKVFSGPFATRMFADYGAEVIKIESQEQYDDARDYPPFRNGWSGYFEILNRNKNGISLNLKQEKDREQFYRLSEAADVIVENLTPDTKFKLSVDYETIRKYNPTIIYASLSGIGQNSNRKYYDVIAQAQSGLLSLVGMPDLPVKIGPSVVDAFSGMTLAFAVASALYFKQRTGKGQYLDVSMLSSAMNLLESNLIAASLTKKDPGRTGNVDNLIAPFGVYRTKDSYIALAVGNKSQWESLFQFLEKHRHIPLAKLKNNTLRLRHSALLTEILESVFTRYKTAPLVAMLSELSIPCEKVNSMTDVLKLDNIFASGALCQMQHSKLGDCVIPGRSIIFSEGKTQTMREAPKIGKDNDMYGI